MYVYANMNSDTNNINSKQFCSFLSQSSPSLLRVMSSRPIYPNTSPENLENSEKSENSENPENSENQKVIRQESQKKSLSYFISNKYKKKCIHPQITK